MTKSPTPAPLHSVPLQISESHTFANGCTLHWLEGGSQDVCKIEWIWEHEPKGNFAFFERDIAQKMMMEGSKSYSRKQISELLDYYGIYTQFESGFNQSSMIWYGLSKNIPSLIDLFFDISLNPTYSPKEFEIFQKNELSAFDLAQEKVSNLARKKFFSAYYQQHPWGTIPQRSDIEQLNTERLKFIHQEFYLRPFHVFISGKKIQEIVELFGKTIDKISINTASIQEHWTTKPNYSFLTIEKQNAQQNALRLGRPIMSRHHDDFFDFQVLNTILGGYFGSRLMKNLREDKGYTYGVGSMILPLKEESIFVISAEVKSDESKNALEEIKFEMDLLQNQLIPQDELDLVVSYLKGQAIIGFDGVFSHMDRNKIIALNRLSSNYFDDFFNHLSIVQTEKLQKLAQDYLNWDQMVIVSAGMID